jgi:hypothetical protein
LLGNRHVAGAGDGDSLVLDQTSGPADPAEPGRDDGRELTARQRLMRRWAPIVVLVAVPALLVSLQVRAYPKLSPIDELQHIDYMFRSPGLHPVVAGTRVSQAALRQEACRGIDARFTPPPCASKVLRPGQFQEGGYDTEYLQPPTYYDVTWVLGKIVKPLTGATSWVTAWRRVGALWLSAGLVLTYLAGLRFGVRRIPLLGFLLLCASTPVLVFSSSTVNNDATSVAVGGAALYLLARFEASKSRWRWALLAAIGVLGTVIKLQDVMVVIVVIGYLLLRARGRVPAGSERRGIRELCRVEELRWTGILALSSLVVAGSWAATQAAYELVNPSSLSINIRYRVDSISVAQVAGAFGVFVSLFVTPFPGTYVPPGLQSVWTSDMTNVVTWALLAGLIAGAVFVGTGDRIAALSRATLAVVVLGAPLFVVLYFVTLHQYGVIPPRYGFSLVPALVVCGAGAVRARWVGTGVLGAGLLGVGLAVLQLA